MKYRDLLKMLHDDGWQHIRTTGSHQHYKHATKPGLVTVPAGESSPTKSRKEHCVPFFVRPG